MGLNGTILLKISVALIVIRNVCYGQAPTCFTSEQYFSGYRPEQSVTETGFSCERWDELTELITDNDLKDETLSEAANFCRNPDQSQFYWCYAVPDSEKRDCFDTTSADYVGTRNVTITGLSCQRWDVTTPHNHTNKDSTVFPDGSATAAENYCRDPDGLGTPWCFTLNPDVRSEECDIAKCKDLKDKVKKSTCGIELCEPVSSRCPTSWLRSEGGTTCYYVSRDREPWEKSVAACSSFDANLLEIDDETENYFLESSLLKLKDEKEIFWMALTDQETEGSFVWSTSDKSPDFTDWSPGEPDDFFNREDCVSMFKVKGGEHTWRDDDCTRGYYYICELNATASTVAIVRFKECVSCSEITSLISLLCEIETTVEPTTQEASGQTINTTDITTITSGCKQPFEINLMAAVLPVIIISVIMPPKP